MWKFSTHQVEINGITWLLNWNCDLSTILTTIFSITILTLVTTYFQHLNNFLFECEIAFQFLYSLCCFICSLVLENIASTLSRRMIRHKNEFCCTIAFRKIDPALICAFAVVYTLLFVLFLLLLNKHQKNVTETSRLTKY